MICSPSVVFHLPSTVDSLLRGIINSVCLDESSFRYLAAGPKEGESDQREGRAREGEEREGRGEGGRGKGGKREEGEEGGKREGKGGRGYFYLVSMTE